MPEVELIFHRCVITDICHPLWEMKKINVNVSGERQQMIVHMSVHDATVEAIKAGRFHEFYKLARVLRNV